jgi:hypothetical protein
MARKRNVFLSALLAATVALGACTDSSSPSADGAGRVSVRLVDAPGDLEEAWVQISEIYLLPGESDAESPSGRLPLVGPADEYYDLLSLTDGRFAELVREAVVPAGTYSVLRVKIGEAYVVTRDGNVYATDGADLPAGLERTGTLQRTRGKSSGYQVKFPKGGLRVDGETTIVVLDLDVGKSFGHVAGKSGRYILHPKMTATEVALSGTIRGIVTAAEDAEFPACGGAETDLKHFVPTATDADGEEYTARTGADGSFAFGFVAPGSYTLGHAAIVYENGDTLTFAAAATPASVTVGSGGTALADYAVSGAVCAPAAPAGSE